MDERTSALEEVIGRTVDLVAAVVVLWVIANVSRNVGQAIWAEGFRAGFNARQVAADGRRQRQEQEVTHA